MKEAVCILIERDDGKFLGVSRKNDPNDFGLPGGSVEKGETNIQAIIRELKEETGLDVKNIIPVFISFCGEYETTTFIGDVFGDINTSEPGKVAWVNKEDLLNGSFGKYNASLFKKLRM